MRRVVITGMAGISAIGQDWETVSKRLKSMKNATQYMENWDIYEGLNTRLGAPVLDFELPEHYTRKALRTMSRISQFSTRSSELAVIDAGLINDPVLKSGRAGVSFGSSTGGTNSIRDMASMDFLSSTEMVKANTYIKMMPHTTTFNVGAFLGMTGRLLPSSSACTSGSLAIGMGYENIKFGLQDIMVCGGAEELCPTEAAVFDTLYATSTMNETPELTPSPYDKSRDGLVTGEGGCAFVLEEFERAKNRGAHIYAELLGFGNNSDGKHAMRPEVSTMGVAMQLALDDAGIDSDAIGYVSAHGTATDTGDIAESEATLHIFGRAVPISSLKSYIGHTLGACGALEAWMSIHMMNEGWFAPTINLNTVDEACAGLDYICGECRAINTDYIMSNNFAFGGVNTSLIFKRWT